MVLLRNWFCVEFYRTNTQQIHCILILHSVIYSNGLPDEYSFLTTFRMTGATLQKYWTIWQIQDSSGKEQVGVNLNGPMKSVEFSYKGVDGSLQTASFLHLPFLFDSQWHKLMISVETTSVTLFIDCIKVETLNIKPKGKISVDGFSVLGRLKNNPQISVPVSFKILYYWKNIKCFILNLSMEHIFKYFLKTKMAENNPLGR